MRPQKEFIYLKEFKKKFPITDRTIFAYRGEIYSNNDLPEDIEVHELTHLRRQDIDPDGWIKKYLEYPEFRLQEELISFREQIKFIKDREAKNFCRMECARNLADNYGLNITYQEALKKLS